MSALELRQMVFRISIRYVHLSKQQIVDLQACKLGVIMVIAVSCVKLLSARSSWSRSRSERTGSLGTSVGARCPYGQEKKEMAGGWRADEMTKLWRLSPSLF